MRKGSSGRVVLADVPPERNQNEGTFACSHGTKTGTRAHSTKPPLITKPPFSLPVSIIKLSDLKAEAPELSSRQLSPPPPRPYLAKHGAKNRWEIRMVHAKWRRCKTAKLGRNKPQQRTNFRSLYPFFCWIWGNIFPDFLFCSR